MKNIIEINNHQFTFFLNSRRRGLVLLVCSCFLSFLAQGEVTLDGSAGPAGTLTGPDYKVTEHLGKRAGSNLFHSFGRFNLTASESATFSGSTGIENVISRVTGGQASSIDGILRVSIPNANLYLLNPAGLIIGEHAQLDVSGSFHVSTADYLKFQDGVRFNSGVANAPQVLTTATPEAFGFLGNNPTGISLSGNTGSVLAVQKGSTISLIGGDITNENTVIYAPGGRINIASVGSAGEIGLNESGIQTTLFEKMGDIRISQNPLVPRTALATGIKLANIDVSDDTAGKIFIRGGQMVIDNSFIASDPENGNGGDIRIGLAGDLSISAPTRIIGGLFTGSEISTNTRGEGDAGSISLDVARLRLGNRSRINTRALPNSKGNAGNITINANTVQLQDSDPDIVTQITSASFGDGDTGNIAITTDTLEVRGEASIDSSTNGKGNGGDLAIISNKLELRNGAKIFSSVGGSGNGGDLFVESNEIILTNDESVLNNFGPLKEFAPEILATGIQAESSSTGDSGNIEIKVDNLVVQNGAAININNFGTGSSGNLVVDGGTIMLSGNGIGDRTGIANDAFNTGILGRLTVNADNLQIQNSAKIRSITFGAAKGGNLNVVSGTITISGNNRSVFTGITTQAEIFSTGDAGDLTLAAREITFQGSAFISTSTISSGDAGNLLVNVDNLIGNDGALITAQTTGTGDAGNLTVNAKHIKLNDGSKIDTSTFGSGQSGRLTIDAETIFLANDTSSERVSGIFSISRGIEDNAGDSGDLEITANRIEMRDGSLITARTEGFGEGGNLILNVNDLLLNKGRLSSASRFKGVGAGKSGDIQITLGNTLRLENKSDIDVSTDNSNAGDIRIKGGNVLHLSESNITTSVADGKEDGGNIFISTPIMAIDSSNIVARAAKGKGGNITISGLLFQSPGSVVSASSELGIDGNIDLKPDTNISGSIAVLPDSFLNASQQMSDRCTARSGNDMSSFVVKGRGGVPLSPGNLAPSNFTDYLQTKENSGQRSMKDQSLDKNGSLSYIDFGKSFQSVSKNIDCTP